MSNVLPQFYFSYQIVNIRYQTRLLSYPKTQNGSFHSNFERNNLKVQVIISSKFVSNFLLPIRGRTYTLNDILRILLPYFQLYI